MGLLRDDEVLRTNAFSNEVNKRNIEKRQEKWNLKIVLLKKMQLQDVIKIIQGYKAFFHD